MSNNILRGAADTYFSGKTIARLARIIIIAEELQKLQDADTPSSKSLECLYYGDNTVDKIDIQKSITAVSKVKLPSTKDTDLALEQLKIGVTTWLKSNAEAPYIYDTTWGGMVNCGCIYVGKGPNGHCNNTFPDCPALLSVNEDFGNGTFPHCLPSFLVRPLSLRSSSSSSTLHFVISPLRRLHSHSLSISLTISSNRRFFLTPPISYFLCFF